MNKIKSLFFSAGCLFLLLMSGCGFDSKSYQQDFFSMDTYMSISVYGKNAKDAADACISEIQRLDQLLDKNDSESDIYRLNHAQGAAISLNSETWELLSLAYTYAQQTGGTFDPTINAISELWGIGSDQERVPSAEELSNALKQVGYRKLLLSDGKAQLTDGATIDLGGIAKGYAADRAITILKQYGIERAVLSLGGNVYVLGNAQNGQPWKVGIQDPDHSQEIVATLSLSNCSAVTSGDYERYFEQNGVRYHHLLDPQTGYPSDQGIRSVTVLCESSTQADAYSTALFVMGSEKGLSFCQEQGIDAVFVLADGSIRYTEGLKDSLSIAQ